MEIVGGEFHTAFTGWCAFRHAVEAEMAVVVGYNVQGLLVWRDSYSVGFVCVGDDALNFAVGVETVNGHDGLVDGFVTKVAGIAEVDAALCVDGDVVGGVEWLTFEEAGEDDAFACGEVSAGDAATAVVGAFCDYEAALGIELETVGHPAGGTIDGSLVGLGIVAEDVAGLHASFNGEGDVAEEDGAVGGYGDAFGEMAALVDLFELCTGGEDLRCQLRGGEEDEQAGGWLHLIGILSRGVLYESLAILRIW